MPNSKNSVSAKLPTYFLLILLAIGLLWLKSSYGKITGGTFVDGLGKTLTMFASKNPHPWYKDFLTNVAIPNSTIFGLLTMWGELLAALAICGGVILLIVNSGSKLPKVILALGLVGGTLLNVIFWLAAGWTSASTDSLNLLMAIVQAIAAFAVAKSATNA